MKTTKIFMLALACLGFVACDKHDPFDDILITGEVGPQAYWTIESSMVSAGSEMGFTVQYYTSLKNEGVKIDSSSVWYNITENVEKSVSCPYVTFSITQNTTEEKRVMQFIKGYPHSEDFYSDSLRAYTYTSTFPVSGTLAPFSWVNPTIYVKDNMDNYFGKDFPTLFKDSLKSTLNFSKYETLLRGCGLAGGYIPGSEVEGFSFDKDFWDQYTDSVFDPNTNSTLYDFVGNKDSVYSDSTWVYSFRENIVVPEEVAKIYDAIPFEELIQKDGTYNIIYKLTNKLRAQLRVYDDRGVYGTTQPKEIDVN